MKKETSVAEKWFVQERPLYESLTEKVRDILEEVLNAEKINYHKIEHRTKSIESFANKIKNFKNMPPKEMQDLSGIRVITYFKSDLRKVGSIVRRIFEVDDSKSQDKANILGTDKMGYLSLHFVAKFAIDRLNLPEYSKFTDMFFEIQVRTILQHAWAEMQHDKNYKLSGVLPKEITRNFKILAGLLELGDNEFDRLLKEIDTYSQEVLRKTKMGNLDISLDSTSLRQYLLEKFKRYPQIEQVFGPKDDMSTDLVNELKSMGINTLKDLDSIIPADLGENIIKLKSYSNFCGVIRDILIIHDAEKYFSTAWNNSWTSDKEQDRIYETYGIDMDRLDKRYKFRFQEGPV